MQINEKAPFRENECYEDNTAQGVLERGWVATLGQSESFSEEVIFAEM